MLPYEPVSLLVATVAAGLVVLAWRFASARPRPALAAAVLAGCLLRLDAAWQHSLHRPGMIAAAHERVRRVS